MRSVVVVIGAGLIGQAIARRSAYAAAHVRFTSTEITELNRGGRAIEIRGARLPDQVLVLSGVEAPTKK